MSDDNAGKLTRLEEEGELAADYLEELLDIADLDGDIEIDVVEGESPRRADRAAQPKRPWHELRDQRREGQRQPAVRGRGRFRAGRGAAGARHPIQGRPGG